MRCENMHKGNALFPRMHHVCVKSMRHLVTLSICPFTYMVASVVSRTSPGCSGVTSNPMPW